MNAVVPARMTVRPYTEADAGQWDELVGRSDCGTFLHTRRFLSYHGSRFEDRSMVCVDEGRLAGVFPAALVPGDPACVASHPGATYGGLLCGGTAHADRVGAMLEQIVASYRSRGLQSLVYKSVPMHLHAVAAQSDLRAIWKLGGMVAQRDLWNVLTLGEGRPPYSSHHVRAIERARKQGVVIDVSESGDAYRGFHGMLEERLADRYGVAPVHTLEEMQVLRERFPESVTLWLARDAAGRPVAGTWLFMFGRRAWHTQYIAANAQGRDLCATHLLFDSLIREAERLGIRFVSFGRSSEDEGRRLNAGLFAFKSGFGAGAVCHDTYRIGLA